MNPEEHNPNKPVAYDEKGNPLYAHPPQQPHAPAQGPAYQPQVVYSSRPIDPHRQEVSPEILAKHEQSKKLYPQLSLSVGEYVISAVRRHPIGLVSIWAVVIVAVVMIVVGFPLLISSNNFVSEGGVSSQLIASGGLVLLFTAVLFILGGVIATIVYNANRFYLTNESVIQHIQTSLFTKKDQIISLANIEDASYRQQGIIQTIFNYGAIRLSTEGEETTYRFNFVAHPKQQIDTLNNAVEAFKNVRPVEDN